MKNLKVGQQFEVVEVLTDGDYLSGIFKVCGWTLHFKEFREGGGKTLCNGPNYTIGSISIKYGCHCRHMYRREVKPVGRLTVTKVK